MTRRIRAVGEAAVPDWVQRAARKFEYPDFDTVAPAAQPGGGGGAPSIVIAAADASDLSKSKADFVCTGTNDEVVIQQANDQLNAINGGRILLTEGNFEISASAGNSAVLISSNVSLVGMGHGSTSINASLGASSVGVDTAGPLVLDLAISTSGGGIAIEAIRGALVRLALNSSELNVLKTGASSILILDCVLTGNGGGIDYVGAHGVISNCIFDVRGAGVRATSGPLVISECSFINALTTEPCILIPNTVGFLRVIGNYSDASGAFVGATGASTHLQESIIANNVVEYSGTVGPSGDRIIDLDNSYHIKLVIADNSFDNGTGIRIGNNATTSPVGGHIITGNTFTSDDTGIYLARSDRSIIAHNRFTPDGHGIVLDDVSEAVIEGNLIESFGAFANNTFDGIHLENDSDENLITDNMLIPRSGGNLSRYGVNVSAADCDCNIVVGNRLGDPAAYGTDALNDAGTNTQLFYPADATYGDNFTDCGSPGSP